MPSNKSSYLHFYSKNPLPKLTGLSKVDWGRKKIERNHYFKNENPLVNLHISLFKVHSNDLKAFGKQKKMRFSFRLNEANCAERISPS